MGAARRRGGRDCAVVMLVAEAELAVDTPAEREQLARLDEHDRVCRPARHALGDVTCRALFVRTIGADIFRLFVPLFGLCVPVFMPRVKSHAVSTNRGEQAGVYRYSVALAGLTA